MSVTIYHLKIVFTQPLLGSQPQKDVATQFVQAKARDLGLEVADEVETLPEMLEKGTTVFHQLDGQRILYDYNFKGFLKESAQVQNGLEGVKALRSKVDNLVFVRPRQIVLHAPQGKIEYLERPLRAQTAQGPRTSLARSEMLPAGTQFECELHVWPGPVSEKVLRGLLDYGRYKGIGQWRNGSYGQFEYELHKA